MRLQAGQGLEHGSIPELRIIEHESILIAVERHLGGEIALGPCGVLVDGRPLAPEVLLRVLTAVDGVRAIALEVLGDSHHQV